MDQAKVCDCLQGGCVATIIVTTDSVVPKTREHTKSLRSASEGRSAFSEFATKPFCSETNCKTVQKWTGTRLDKFTAEQQNGKFLDAIAQRIWISSVRAVLPI